MTFQNRSDHEEHEIIVFKLADKNATIDQAVAAANLYGEHGLIDGGFATAELGELKIGPNSTLDGEFNFAEPGGYVYYCFIETHGTGITAWSARSSSRNRPRRSEPLLSGGAGPRSGPPVRG